MAKMADEKEAALLQKITQAEALQLSLMEQNRHLQEKMVSVEKEHSEEKERNLSQIKAMEEKLTELTLETQQKEEQLADMAKRTMIKEQRLAAMAERAEEKAAVLAQKITETVAMQLSLKEENKRREEEFCQLKIEMEEKENTLTALVESYKMAASENQVTASTSEKAHETEKRKPSRLRKNKVQALEEMLAAVTLQNDQKEGQLAVMHCEMEEKEQQLAAMATLVDENEKQLAELTKEKEQQLEDMAKSVKEKDEQLADVTRDKMAALVQLMDVKAQLAEAKRPASRKEFHSSAKREKSEQAQLQGAQEQRPAQEENGAKNTEEKTMEVTVELGSRPRRKCVFYSQQNNNDARQRQVKKTQSTNSTLIQNRAGVHNWYQPRDFGRNALWGGWGSGAYPRRNREWVQHCDRC
ncbi:hypothetical protein JZ751_015207 [Albula glossodonta]|uniref:Uncharacterized protein n=1 Tax=Albula glossodonta TaxID=121402 RepID=A0A8T2NUS3_9TELE|nr:hypothetical protein JZ751_015207 [Albula glossodonta]